MFNIFKVTIFYNEIVSIIGSILEMTGWKPPHQFLYTQILTFLDVSDNSENLFFRLKKSGYYFMYLSLLRGEKKLSILLTFQSIFFLN